jgi:hypothetical protein
MSAVWVRRTAHAGDKRPALNDVAIVLPLLLVEGPPRGRVPPLCGPVAPPPGEKSLPVTAERGLDAAGQC